VRLLEPIGSLEMSPNLSRVAANIRDSERAAEAWPEALKSMTEAVGAAGAACIRQQDFKQRRLGVLFGPE
jgi:hypothetical protein